MTHTQKHFTCACSSMDHQLRVCRVDDDIYVFIDVFLSSCYPWYKRLWLAVKYVLGCKPGYGHYDEIMLKSEKVRELARLLFDLADECDNALDNEFKKEIGDAN